MDTANQMMRIKLSRIAQKFLGDLDEINSVCLFSEEDLSNHNEDDDVKKSDSI